MAFLIYNKTGIAVPIDDLGLEVAANSSYDLTSESPYDVSISTDLANAITANSIVVLDPRVASAVYPTNAMSASDSQIVVDAHNDPLYGIRGAVISDLDDVDMSGATANDVLQLIGGVMTPVTPAIIAGDIALGDLSDVSDGIATKPITDFYVLTGDGSGGTVLTDAKTDNTVFIPFIEDTAGAVIANGVQTDITLVYNASTNSVDASVDDNFLRNTTDSFDSGTLTFAAGTTFVIAAGATGVIADAPINAGDIANKAYVDSVAQGTDNKDSVHAATNPTEGDLGGTYDPSGGTGGTGAITGIPVVVIDGIDFSVDPIGTRLIVKDQTDPKQNGIYVTTSFTASPVTMNLERSSDMDGNPTSEVSPGNLAFVDAGNVNGSTSWIVTGEIDPIIINTDPVNWTQFSGSGSFTAGRGLGLNGTQFYLDVNNLQAIPVVGIDEIAFNDISDPGITKKRTFDNVIADLGLFTDTNLTASDGVLITNGDIQLDITGLATLTTPTLNAEMVFDVGGTGIHNKGTVADFFNGLDVVHGITANGIVVRTANDTYVSRALVSSIIAGLEGASVLYGSGITGNPEVGIDITGTTASGNNMSSLDTLLMYNGTNNVAVSGTQLANGVASILGGLGNAYTTLIDGIGGTATATSSTDQLAFLNATNGGITTKVSDGGPDSVTFAINADDLTTGTGTVDVSDFLIVSEGAGAVGTVKYTFQDMIDDLNISTSGSLIGNDGVQVVGSTVSLDFVNMPAQGGIANTLPIDINDIFAIDPLVSDVAGTHKKVTFNDMVRDLDIVYGLGGDGIAVQIASDTYVARTLTVSTVAGEQGIILNDGDGIAANPAWGFTINGMSGSAGNLLTTDLVPVFDGTNNVKMTGQQVADGVAALLGGVGNAYTTITGDTGSATAASSSDTLTFIGAPTGGITTSVTDATPDRVEFTLDFNALAPRLTAVTGSMLLGIGEGVSQPTTTRSLDNVLSDLGVPSGIGSLTGILVSNGAGVYSATTIAVKGAGSFDGLNVTNATGVLGSPTLGLDITGTVAAAEILAATDEIVVYNASATANQKMTGQEIADGVTDMIGLGGITISTINGQQVLTLADTTRAGKILSASETEFNWSENRLSNNDWISIGGARDAATGHVMPMNGTIVRITAHTSDDLGVLKPINLYIDGTLDGVIGTFTGVGGESNIVDTTLNIDFIQGGKLRLRAGGGGRIEDTTISIFVKWRA